MSEPYITLSEDEAGNPIVVVGDLGDNRAEIDWPANERGLRNAGRYVFGAFGVSNYTFSSTLDFPAEYGVGLRGDEAHALIQRGIAEARDHE